MEQETSENIQMKVRVNINVADMRAEAESGSERLSQALYNEILEVIDQNNGYLRVRSRDHYEGWMAKQFTAENSGSEGPDRRIVVSNLASGLAEPVEKSKRIVSIPYGCGLDGIIEDDFLRISSERYGVFFVRISELVVDNKKQNRELLGPESLVAEAEKFLSAPYLWGGRSFFGIDCSGFAQAIFQRFGVDLPRDSRDQIKRGEEIARDKIQWGDLLFFPRHVALAVSDNLYIHSSSGNGGVAYNSLNPKDKRYHEYLDKSYITARRVT